MNNIEYKNLAELSAYAKSRLHTYSDPETGCSSRDEIAFQSCRQAYFSRQQNYSIQNLPEQIETNNEKLSSSSTFLSNQISTATTPTSSSLLIENSISITTLLTIVTITILATSVCTSIVIHKLLK